MRTRFVTAVAAAVSTAVIPLGVVPAAAQAEIGSVVCHGGSLTVQYNPGLNFSKRVVRLSAGGDLGLCTSQEHPEITGGSIRVEGSLQASCPGPLGPGSTKVAIAWNDGSTSVIDQSTFRGDIQGFRLDGGFVSQGPFLHGTSRADGRTTTGVRDIGGACVTGGVISYQSTIDNFAAGEL
ncbi:hypothetical protein [Streptomyces sp. NPDC051546]|uniref:hypothetical protein n=1 Tax=Streptomyces sp. NPDC051546 TaxID=3365655 RepID=UPI0037B9D5C9